MAPLCPWAPPIPAFAGWKNRRQSYGSGSPRTCTASAPDASQPMPRYWRALWNAARPWPASPPFGWLDPRLLPSSRPSCRSGRCRIEVHRCLGLSSGNHSGHGPGETRGQTQRSRSCGENRPYVALGAQPMPISSSRFSAIKVLDLPELLIPVLVLIARDLPVLGGRVEAGMTQVLL